MIIRRSAITGSAFAAMFFLGVALAIIGAAARNIGLSPYQIGLLIATQQLGFLLAVGVAGALADSSDKLKMLFTGSLVLAAAFLLFYLTERFWVNLLLMFGAGVGAGIYEGVTDALLLDIQERHQSRYISLNHFFVTLGSGLVTLYLIFLRLHWRWSMVQSGVAVLALAVFFALAKVERPSRPVENIRRRYAGLPHKRILILLFAATVLAVGVELGTVGYLTTFLMELRGFSQTTSKIGLVLFLAGIAGGRLSIGMLVRNHQLRQYITVLFGFSAFLFSALYFMEMGEFTYLVIFCTGAAVSAIAPLLIALAGLTYPEASGAVIGLIKIAIPAGGILLPLVMSILAREYSMQVSLTAFPFTAAAGLAVMLVLGVLARPAAAGKKN